MFCDACGAEITAGQEFCSRCGKKVVGGARLAFPQPGRVQEHIRLLGILWLAISALNALFGTMMVIFGNAVLPHIAELGGPPIPVGILRPLITCFGILVLIKAVLGFAAGWGLLQREPWARLLTLVLAFFSLFHVPFGTALGIYSLWVLLPGPSEKEYEGLARVA